MIKMNTQKPKWNQHLRKTQSCSCIFFAEYLGWRLNFWNKEETKIIKNQKVSISKFYD